MSTSSADLELATCATCHLRFLPGGPACPRCASRTLTTVRVPAVGVVLASTEVLYPSEGWAAPHRLALVEVAEAVRLLAVVEGPLPAAGASVGLEAGTDHLTARTATSSRAGRGEGDSPRRRGSGASFEPPR